MTDTIHTQIAEVDELEIISETNGKGIPVCEKMDNVMECPMNIEEVFWSQVGW